MLFRLLKEMLCKWSRHQQLPKFHRIKCFQKLVFILSHTFAIKTVKRKISGEICKSHLLESRRTDFAAANLMWGLSLSLPKNVQWHSLRARFYIRKKNKSRDENWQVCYLHPESIFCLFIQSWSHFLILFPKSYYNVLIEMYW
jgi:hypothetical protein